LEVYELPESVFFTHARYYSMKSGIHAPPVPTGRESATGGRADRLSKRGCPGHFKTLSPVLVPGQI